MEKNNKKIKIIYGLIVGLLCFGLQTLTYNIANLLIVSFNIKTFVPKIESIDDYIPFITIFVLPYIWSYVYWVLGPMAASVVDFKHFLNIVLGYLITNVLGFVIFLVYPTYIDRVAEGVYGRAQNDFFDWLLSIVYDWDGKNIGRCLFPSMHCMNTTICLFATFRKKEIPLWYRIYQFIMAILIYLSTMFIKQHYFLDMVFGVLIAIIVWIIINKFNLGYKLFNRPVEYFKNKFQKRKEE